MQIEQVIGGVNGDTTAQAIQLRMRSPAQNFVSGGRLVAYDSAGLNPVVLVNFGNDVANGSTGDRILVTSSNFAAYASGVLSADFTLTSLIPSDYLVAGRLTFERDTGQILWSLSWGDINYIGDTKGTLDNDPDGEFGPSVNGALPSGDLRALQFQGSATASSTSNLADYALTSGASVWVNNARRSFQLVGTVFPLGDVNGDSRVTGADSLLINQVQVGLRSNTHPIFAVTGFGNGDVNQNGSVSGADSLLINQTLVGLRAHLTSRVLPPVRTNTALMAVTIHGIGFPTNETPVITVGAPVNLTLTNVVVAGREKITALVPTGGGIGTGTVNVVTTTTNGAISFGRFVNQ
jgi:hypothetical protein